MTKRDDSLRDLEVRLDDIPCRVLTPPDEDDGDEECPKKDPGPGGMRN